jgi:hypothetical protein
MKWGEGNTLNPKPTLLLRALGLSSNPYVIVRDPFQCVHPIYENWSCVTISIPQKRKNIQDFFHPPQPLPMPLSAP